MVEVWKVDDSRPAPHFNVIVTPNEWRRETARSVRVGSVSEKNRRYKVFFQELIDALRELGFTNARKGQPLNSYYFSARHVQYGAIFAQGKRARVEVYIDNADRDWNKTLFDQLMGRKESIESELSESLEWGRLDGRRASRIAIVRQGSIDDDQEALEDIKNWMIDKLRAFKRVFGPMLDELVT